MSGLPVVSSAELCDILSLKGFFFDHQKGSHIVLRRYEHPFLRVTIPYRKEVPKGTLRAILRQAGLTVEEFRLLLK